MNSLDIVIASPKQIPPTQLAYSELQHLMRGAREAMTLQLPVLKSRGQLPHTDKTVSHEQELQSALTAATDYLDAQITKCTAPPVGKQYTYSDEINIAPLAVGIKALYATIAANISQSHDEKLVMVGVKSVMKSLRIPEPKSNAAGR